MLASTATIAGAGALGSGERLARLPHDVGERRLLPISIARALAAPPAATASQSMLLIERRAPDTMGGRLVMVSYHHIQALKIVDVVKMKVFQSLGFDVPPPRK
jgi:hypothetical protein